MKKQKLYTFREDLEESLKDPAFWQAWKESEPEYLVAKQLIEKRLQRKLAQRNER